MDNKIERYVHTEFGELDILQEGDKFLFPARKCAEILGYSNPLDAVRRHCRGCVKHAVLTNGGSQERIYIPEGDLYRLIIRSKLESAQRFESWVFDTILPSIRKHGAYIMPELLDELQTNTAKNAELIGKLAAESEEYRTRNKQLTEALEAAKPKLSYYDTILQNPDAMPVTLIAKDYGMSARKFNILLHDLHLQFRVGGTWELYQEYAGFGYTHGNVNFRGNMHTCWTQRGRLFLYEFLKKRRILPKIEVI